MLCQGHAAYVRMLSIGSKTPVSGNANLLNTVIQERYTQRLMRPCETPSMGGGVQRSDVVSDKAAERVQQDIANLVG